MCEGDDYWIDPLKLQKQVLLAERHSLALCIHSCKNLNAQNHTEVCHPLPTSGFVSSDVIIGNSGGLFATASYMFRTNVISSLPSWFSKAPIGDYFLTILAATKGPAYFLRDVMCVYRVLSVNSWSARPKTLEWHNNFYRGLVSSLHQFNEMTEGRYFNAISVKKKQILADNIREHTKYDKKGAFKKLVRNSSNISLTSTLVILNRILFK